VAFQRATYLSNIQDGELLGTTVAGVDLVLVRQGDIVRAFQRRCPHQGADLADGIVSRGYLICALHAWRFSLADGSLDLEPNTCLRTYPVRIEDGAVYVDVG